MADAFTITDCELVETEIEAALDKLGMSQVKASQLSGVSYQHLNRLVRGHHMPSLQMAMRLSAFTGEPIEKLFRFKIRRRRVSRKQRKAT